MSEVYIWSTVYIGCAWSRPTGVKHISSFNYWSRNFVFALEFQLKRFVNLLCKSSQVKTTAHCSKHTTVNLRGWTWSWDYSLADLFWIGGYVLYGVGHVSHNFGMSVSCPGMDPCSYYALCTYLVSYSDS